MSTFFGAPGFTRPRVTGFPSRSGNGRFKSLIGSVFPLELRRPVFAGQSLDRARLGRPQRLSGHIDRT
jgi:hypothetical protein